MPLKFISVNFVRDVADVLWGTHSMLCVKFDVRFEGEDGIDGGALTAEMYKRFLQAVCNSERFQKGAKGKFLPRGATELTEEDLKIYRAIGVALARILLEERAINVPFASALFKFFQNGEMDMEDLCEFDPQDYRNMSILLSPKGDCSDYNFADLGEDERNVNQGNKAEYVKKFVQKTLVGDRVLALLAMRDGFQALGEGVNVHIRILTPQDLKTLVCGKESLTPPDLLNRLQFEGFDQSSTPDFLREVINGMSEEELRRFLCFVTSQDSLPVITAEVKPIKVLRVPGDDKRIPEAHACFWQLDIPDYTSSDALRERLLMAISEENMTFTMH